MVGRKRYVDQTIPTGTTAIAYRICAVRSTKRGQPAVFTVKFGSNGMPPLPHYAPKIRA